MTAKATLALKAGVWFRRGRLLIVSPVQQQSCSLSARSSTYRSVQISRASSQGGNAAEICLSTLGISSVECCDGFAEGKNDLGPPLMPMLLAPHIGKLILDG